MTRKLSKMSILLALGLVLNLSVQVFSLQGMKVDFVVVMLVISLLNADNHQEMLMAAISFGILTALTTTFPNGQIANLVDKLVVGFIMYNLNRLMKVDYDNKPKVILFTALSTIISGTVFLSVALYLSSSTELFNLLFLTVVIPSTIGNSIMMALISTIFKKRLIIF